MGNSSSRRTSRASFSDVVVEEQANEPVAGVPVHQGVAAVPTTTTNTNADAGQPPTTTDARLALNITAECEALAACEAHKMLAMLSLKAPIAPESAPRPPLDLVVAADRSGSMHGEKIQLMRQTLELLVKRSGLQAEDRVSLVSFDSNVKLELPLEKMDAAGRAKAEGIVRRLHPGSTTNLSGGALQAIDVLDASAATRGKEEKRTRAVMLFTDGLANQGIRDTAEMCTAVRGALRAASDKLGDPISLFTFGFGSDHSEDCLRRLANESGSAGQYYYVRTAEDIPNAFADCLGGLTSVVAQNATLSLQAAGGASIERVLGSAYTYAAGTIALGDLFAEDEKDVLVELSLPALPAPVEEPPIVLKVSLRAFNVTINSPDSVETSLEVARPRTTPANQRVNEVIDAQRNRLETAAAMEQASALADRGDLMGGRDLLHACRQRVAESASANYALSSALVSEMDVLERNYVSEEQYRAFGSKMSRMQARSHQIQRSNHLSTASYKAGSKRKVAMKKMWGLSSVSSLGGGSDSD